MGNLSAALAKNSLLKQSRTNGAGGVTSRNEKATTVNIHNFDCTEREMRGEKKYNSGEKKKSPATRLRR